MAKRKNKVVVTGVKTPIERFQTFMQGKGFSGVVRNGCWAGGHTSVIDPEKHGFEARTVTLLRVSREKRFNGRYQWLISATLDAYRFLDEDGAYNRPYSTAIMAMLEKHLNKDELAIDGATITAAGPVARALAWLDTPGGELVECAALDVTYETMTDMNFTELHAILDSIPDPRQSIANNLHNSAIEFVSNRGMVTEPDLIEKVFTDLGVDLEAIALEVEANNAMPEPEPEPEPEPTRITPILQTGAAADMATLTILPKSTKRVKA